MLTPIFLHSHRRQWGALALALVALAVYMGWNLRASRDAIAVQQSERLASAARVLDDNMVRQLASVSSALVSVRNDLAFLSGQPNPQHVLNRRLQSLSDAMPGVRTLSVLDAAGTVQASSRAELVGLNVAQRAYVQTVQIQPDRNVLYVSAPFKTALGVFAINLVRVEVDAQGRLRTIVAATLDPEFFDILMNSVRYTSDMWVSLAHGDGLLVNRQPDRPDLLGGDLTRPGSMFSRHRASGELATVLQGQVAMTGEASLMAQRTIAPGPLRMDKPLVVAVARTQAAIFADWEQEAVRTAAVWLVLGLALSLALFLNQQRQRVLQQQLQQQENFRRQAQQDVQERERFLHEMADSIPGMLAYWDRDLRCGFANKSYLEWFGKTSAEMQGFSLPELLGPALFAKNEPYVQRALQGALQQFERVLVKPSGERGFTWAQYIPFVKSNGEVEGFFALVTDITPLRRSEEQQRLSDVALQASTSGVVITDAQGQVLSVNDSFVALTGYAREEFLGRNCGFLQGPLTDAAMRLKIRQAVRQGQAFSADILNYRKDGSTFWNALNISPVRDEQGQLTHFIGVSQDVSARKKANEELRIAATAFESQEGIFVTGVDRRILRVNRSFCRISGYTDAEVIGQPVDMVLAGRMDLALREQIWDGLQVAGSWQGESAMRTKNSAEVPVSVTVTAVRNDVGVTTHYVANLLDISERKRAEGEIRKLAFYDPLTQLPNRRLLMDRLQQMLNANLRRERLGAVMFLDLDKFKLLNDTHGHDQGDLLLQQVAQRLRACVREGDTVARLGGDEFVLLLNDMESAPDVAGAYALALAQKILDVLNEDYALSGFHYHCSSSIGVTLFGSKLEPLDEIVKRADQAMYEAKASGRNMVRMHPPP